MYTTFDSEMNKHPNLLTLMVLMCSKGYIQYLVCVCVCVCVNEVFVGPPIARGGRKRGNTHTHTHTQNTKNKTWFYINSSIASCIYYRQHESDHANSSPSLPRRDGKSHEGPL